MTENNKRSRGGPMPFAVLLPKLGTVSDLSALGATLEDRIEELHRLSEQTEEPGKLAQLRSEESMLNQVMQWLSVGDKG